MKRAMNVFVCVVLSITSFDTIIWIGDCYWRSIGERNLKIERTKDRLLFVADCVNSYIQKNKQVPSAISEVVYRRTDGWDNELHLEKTADGVRVVSAGPDGKIGTKDDMKSELVNGIK